MYVNKLRRKSQVCRLPARQAVTIIQADEYGSTDHRLCKVSSDDHGHGLKMHRKFALEPVAP
jgi:hypothetical protein